MCGKLAAYKFVLAASYNNIDISASPIYTCCTLFHCIEGFIVTLFMLMLIFNGCADVRSNEDIKAEETELFTKYYTEWKKGGDKDKSFSNIPRFYYKVSFHHKQFKPSNKP